MIKDMEIGESAYCPEHAISNGLIDGNCAALSWLDDDGDDKVFIQRIGHKAFIWIDDYNIDNYNIEQLLILRRGCLFNHDM